MKLAPEKKLEILRRWDELGRAARLAPTRPRHPQRLADVQTLFEFNRIVCRATLYNWQRRWLDSGRDGLIDGRRRGPLDRSADPFMQHAKLLRSRSGRKMTVKECHRLASWRANAEGWKQHSYKTTLRYINRCGLGGNRQVKRAAKAVRPAF